ncbi:MAG TPA: NAD(P)H-binding protein [Candidatus Thermoplasmatota archaeon]|nr:NAD(P)H-binding protein [Candidatus Thermoplasmatota archaeon]
MKVAITGGTGFTGPAIVEETLREGHEVVLLEHRKRAPVANHTRLARVKADVDDAASLARAFEGCDAVMHLVAIIREDKKRGATFERVHVEGTRHVVDAANAAGVRRFILMSANGVELGVDTPYFRTKLAMEAMVKEAGFEWTIFRPSYIAASDAGGAGRTLRGSSAPQQSLGFDAQFADIVDKAPVLPAFGGGRFEIQPVARANVAQAFARALAKPEAIGKTYVLVGPERLTWREYLRRLGALRRRTRPIVYAPTGAVLLAARALGPLFPADADQLRMLVAGNVGDATEAVKDLDLRLETWESAVAGLRR